MENTDMENTDMEHTKSMRKKWNPEYMRRGWNMAAAFWSDETGAGVVEMILIIVVLIGLVLIFKTQLTKIVNSIFKTISSKAGSV